MNIIPTPKKIELTEDKYYLLEGTVATYEEFAGAIVSFKEYVKRIYNLDIQVKQDASIQIVKDNSMPEEAYTLEIKDGKVNIYAAEMTGVNHAFATILQIMDVENGLLRLPEVQITDKPDAIYRSMMVDLARVWHSFDYVLGYVDMCYFYKTSALHLHFTDDQSYTLPSKLFPKLSTEARSYTREQIQELVEYAHARGIELIPEIDVPGHCKSFAEGYGELFGTNAIICQHEDSMQAMRDLFAELCDMFPYSKYIHIGGDEAWAMEEWTKCPKCQAYAKSVGIDADMEDKKQLCEEMYVHFINEMAKIVFAKGKRPIVWEGFAKCMNDKISREMWVMAWENYYQVTADLLEAGFTIINCSWNPTYVVTPVVMWSQKEVFDWSLYSWKAVHPDSPIKENGYEAPKSKQIIGGQLHAWGDAIIRECSDFEEGVYQEWNHVMDRLPIVAENTWNIEKITDFESIMAALDVQKEKLAKIQGKVTKYYADRREASDAIAQQAEF